MALTRARDVPNETDPFHHGTGDWLDPITGKMTFPESHFNLLDSRVKVTCFEEIFETVASSVQEKIGRMRIMKVGAKRCYLYHADDEYRYHLAVVTNPSAFVVFEDSLPILIPTDGRL